MGPNKTKPKRVVWLPRLWRQLNDAELHYAVSLCEAISRDYTVGELAHISALGLNDADLGLGLILPNGGISRVLTATTYGLNTMSLCYVALDNRSTVNLFGVYVAVMRHNSPDELMRIHRAHCEAAVISEIGLNLQTEE